MTRYDYERGDIGAAPELHEWIRRELDKLRALYLTPAYTWDDLGVSLTTAKPGATRQPGFEKFKDDGAGSTGVYAWHFDGSAVEELFFERQLPHAIRQLQGELRPHIHWSPKTTSAGNVRWGLEYTGVSPLGVFGNTTIIYAEDAAEAHSTHQIAQFPAIDATTLAISSVLVCRLFRDAAHGNDTYAPDAVATSFDFHIELDGRGSEQEYVK